MRHPECASFNLYMCAFHGALFLLMKEMTLYALGVYVTEGDFHRPAQSGHRSGDSSRTEQLRIYVDDIRFVG